MWPSPIPPTRPKATSPGLGVPVALSSASRAGAGGAASPPPTPRAGRRSRSLTCILLTRGRRYQPTRSRAPPGARSVTQERGRALVQLVELEAAREVVGAIALEQVVGA